MYRPPGPIANFTSDFLAYILSSSSLADRIIIQGDINLWIENTNDSTVTEFVQDLASLGFNQLVQEPTHEKGHSLVVLFSRNCGTSVLMITPVPWSDHYVIHCKLLNFAPFLHAKGQPMQTSSEFREFKNITTAFKANYPEKSHTRIDTLDEQLDQFEVQLLQLEEDISKFDVKIPCTLSKVAPLITSTTRPKLCKKQTMVHTGF